MARRWTHEFNCLTFGDSPSCLLQWEHGRFGRGSVTRFPPEGGTTNRSEAVVSGGCP